MEIIKETDGFRLTTKQAGFGIDISENGADCSLYTTPQTKTAKNLSFDGPGEFEVKSTLIDGVALSKKTGYILSGDGLRVGLIPSDSVTDQLTQAEAERYHDLDVLITPVEDDKAEVAIKLISQLEPVVIVPYGGNQSGIKHLQSEFGEKCTDEDRLRLSKKDIGEVQRMVCLKS
jgi:hypothetical protein